MSEVKLNIQYESTDYIEMYDDAKYFNSTIWVAIGKKYTEINVDDTHEQSAIRLTKQQFEYLIEWYNKNK